MRNPVSLPKNRITQGTIFCGVKSAYKSLAYCHGICITARCDTARDFKAPSLTFLPVIPMHTWLWEEALPKAISDQKKAVTGFISNHLVNKFGTNTILESFGIENAFDSADQKDKSIIAQRKLYDAAVTAEALSPYEWKKIPESISKKITAEASLLLEGKIQDFYFIDNVEAPYGSESSNINDGYVVSFRDIRVISREGALKILNGIEHEKLKKMMEHDYSLHNLYTNDEVIVYPTGELSSPYIEQLMQNFSLVFSRIGTNNVPNFYKESIQKLVKGEK